MNEKFIQPVLKSVALFYSATSILEHFYLNVKSNFFILFFFSFQELFQRDTDITFEDLVNLQQNKNVNNNNNKIVSKRSVSEEPNHDLEDLIENDLDISSEHWLTRSFKRIKRSLGSFLSSEQISDAKISSKHKRNNPVTEDIKEITLKSNKSKKKLHKKHKSHVTEDIERPKRNL